MMRYTLNGHRHPVSTARDRPRLLEHDGSSVIIHQQALEAEVSPYPERFDCLLSADPRVQLQDALKQIDLLLTRNAALVELVGVLVGALRRSQAEARWARGIGHDAEDHRALRQRSLDPD